MKNDNAFYREFVTYNNSSYSDQEFLGDTIVLINHNVCSSSEVAVLYSTMMKNSILVGSKTGGVNNFGNIEGYILPKSNLLVMIPTSVFHHELFNEGVGILPKYWLDSEDPINDIIKWIKG